MFETLCPNCKTFYRLDDSLLGKKAACKTCRNVFYLEEKDSSTIDAARQKPKTDSFFEFRNNETEPFVTPSVVQPQVPAGAWNVGEVILATYEVKAIAPGVPFAAGGVGVVNRVYHHEWNIDLAVKSPKSEFFQNEAGKASYEKEAQTWIELGLHPNIVTCYLVRRIDGVPRLFAEFISDGSLRDWIQNRKLYKDGTEAATLRIIDIAIQFAWGLHYAHRQGLLHLDVKPANVMMSGETAKVSDFGLSQSLIDARLLETAPTPDKEDSKARHARILASYGNVGLTPGYCSPEQFRLVDAIKKMQFDHLPKMTVGTDIWSWAVSIVAMFFGGSPCNQGGQFARSACESILQAPPKRPDLPAIPKPLGELLLHCFEDEPQKRPKSMEEIAERLMVMYQELSGSTYFRLPPIGASRTPENINNLAVSMLDLNQYDAAEKLFREALTLQPWHSEITYNQTLSAWRRGTMTDLDAVKRLEMLVKMQPESSSAVYGLGLAQRERGNVFSALDAFADALELEERSDVRHAAETTQPFADVSVRCIDRFGLAPASEDSILVDKDDKYILYPADEKTLQIRSTETGQILHVFKVQKHTVPQSGRLALSNDLLYELLIVDTDLALRHVGAKHYTAVFSTISWKQYAKTKAKKRPLQSICTDAHILGEAAGNKVIIANLVSQKKIGELTGHEADITALAISLDGRLAVTGSEDRTLRIWTLPQRADSSSCRCLRTLPGFRETIESVYIGRNFNFVLTLTTGRELRIWDISIISNAVLVSKLFRAPILLSHITSSEEISKQQYEMRKICGVIRQNVADADYGAALQNVQKAETMKGWNASKIAFEADGTSDTIRRHCTREALQSILCTHTFRGSDEPVTTVDISLDGNLIASAGRDLYIRIWNIAEQKCSAVLQGHRDWIRSVTLTSDARFLVSGSWDSTVRVWNIQTGQCIQTIDNRVKQLTKLVLNPLETIVAAGTSDGTVIFWDARSSKMIRRWSAHNGDVNSIQFSRSGHYFITGGSDNKVCLWNMKDDFPVATISVHSEPVTAVRLSADCTKVFSADSSGQIAVWNVPEQKLQTKFQAHIADVSALELFQDERFILSASKDAALRLTNLVTMSREKDVEGHADAVTSMALNISGKRLVTGCEDGVVRTWELTWDFQFPGWQPLSPQAEAVLRHLAMMYSPDGIQPPQIDNFAEKRILLEMEYRGFGMIPSDVLKQALRQAASKE